MPRIVALRRGSVVGADLGHVTFQLSLGATSIPVGDDQLHCFSLLFSYPQATSHSWRPVDSALFQAPPGTTSLVQVPIALAESQEELERVARASAGLSTMEKDIARMTEAFNLFKNRPREIAQARLDACVRDASEVVKGYYDIREWITGGMHKQKEIKMVTSYAQREGETMESVLVLQP